MAKSSVDLLNPDHLRSHATALLKRRASGPLKAGARFDGLDNLAVLHELQVHQVELELQAEELRDSRNELERSLVYLSRLYDFAPVALFTVDQNTVISEANLAAGRLLGADRDRLIGRTLDACLTPAASQSLRAVLGGLDRLVQSGACTLQLAQPGPDGPRFVHASAGRDPAGGRFLLALMAVDEDAG